MEKSITLEILRIIIIIQPSTTETSRSMQTGKEVLFLNVIWCYLTFFSLVLNSIVLEKLQQFL